MKFLLPLGLVALASVGIAPDADWPEYNGDGARSHYSPLPDIDTITVTHLRQAWEYRSGGADTAGNRSQIQCNPLCIKGVVYGVSAGTQVFALDAGTGQEQWKTALPDVGGTTSRGVSYWSDGTEGRLFFGAGRWLYALDARTGKPVPSFADNGKIDLKNGIDRPGADDYVRLNTPATVFRDLVIVGARVSESETALLGDIRAYDARSGKLVWTFRTIPLPGEPGYETWSPANPRQRLGGANAWAGMAIDRQRGIVYIPTGSAAYDFFGGNRKGSNLYANCLLALDATTGKKRWHFQFVHHDIWDRDPPAPPNLLTIVRNGRRQDVVAQVTKQGEVYVFDRENGRPVFPVKEVPVPTDGVPGEVPYPTQPVSELLFARQSFTVKDIYSRAADRDSLVRVLGKARTGRPYLPLTGTMTVFFPGTDGGAQWGGAGTDPAGVLYVPSKEIPVYTSLIPKEVSIGSVTGEKLYRQHCSACHGPDRKGNHDGSYPSLLGVGQRLSGTAIAGVLQKGRGMMPSFTHLKEEERKAVIDFLLEKGGKAMVRKSAASLPYQHTGYNRWYDRNGYPVSMPPWGTLTAIDLNTGARKWQVPLGEYPELTRQGVAPTGTDNYGGPLVTAGGLVFIAATRDEQFRAFDARTGKIRWQVALPAAGYASPTTYRYRGKQYILLACGGGKLNTRSGDRYLAYALPD